MHHHYKDLWLLTIALAFMQTASATETTERCHADSRECMISAATAYLDSIVRHDGSKVPFAPNVHRTEQGEPTGSGIPELLASQSMEPDMKGHANTRFFVDEKQHQVVYFTLLRLAASDSLEAPGRYPRASKDAHTIHLAERLRIEKGLITEIEAIFYIQAGTGEGTSGWPD